MKFIVQLSISVVMISMFPSCEIKRSENISLSKSNEDVWPWPDSLDALIAAPDNHKLVFENDEFRILHVTVIPGILDPVHTHKGRSLIWVTRTSPIIYNTYGFDETNKLELVKIDTINIPPSELNIASWENPEPPHSVENIGQDTFELYRIEYKTNIGKQ